jgi:hypothetical protein
MCIFHTPNVMFVAIQFRILRTPDAYLEMIKKSKVKVSLY